MYLTVISPLLLFLTSKDRNLYRPGESICIKGYARHIKLQEDEQFHKLGNNSIHSIFLTSLEIPNIKQVQYKLVDPRGVKITEGDAVFNPTFGSFDITLTTPTNVNLGSASLHLDTAIGSHIHTINLQEVLSTHLHFS
jgi:uncharacterized protein YfaS (alpha-2-macroglobulin family)